MFSRSLLRALMSAGLAFIGCVGAAPPAASIVMTVAHHNGAQSVDVYGTALPNAAISIVAMAKLSVDLPIVTLNRFNVTADEAGHFSLVVPYAPAFTPTTQVIVQAEAAGISPTAMEFSVGDPTAYPTMPILDGRDTH